MSQNEDFSSPPDPLPEDDETHCCSFTESVHIDCRSSSSSLVNNISSLSSSFGHQQTELKGGNNDCNDWKSVSYFNPKTGTSVIKITSDMSRRNREDTPKHLVTSQELSSGTFVTSTHKSTQGSDNSSDADCLISETVRETGEVDPMETFDLKVDEKEEIDAEEMDVEEKILYIDDKDDQDTAVLPSPDNDKMFSVREQRGLWRTSLSLPQNFNRTQESGEIKSSRPEQQFGFSQIRNEYVSNDDVDFHKSDYNSNRVVASNSNDITRNASVFIGNERSSGPLRLTSLKKSSLQADISPARPTSYLSTASCEMEKPATTSSYSSDISSFIGIPSLDGQISRKDGMKEYSEERNQYNGSNPEWSESSFYTDTAEGSRHDDQPKSFEMKTNSQERQNVDDSSMPAISRLNEHVISTSTLIPCSGNTNHYTTSDHFNINQSEKLRKMAGQKLKKQQKNSGFIKASEIEGHKGDASIEELLNFINGVDVKSTKSGKSSQKSKKLTHDENQSKSETATGKTSGDGSMACDSSDMSVTCDSNDMSVTGNSVTGDGSNASVTCDSRDSSETGNNSDTSVTYNSSDTSVAGNSVTGNSHNALVTCDSRDISETENSSDASLTCDSMSMTCSSTVSVTCNSRDSSATENNSDTSLTCNRNDSSVTCSISDTLVTGDSSDASVTCNNNDNNASVTCDNSNASVTSNDDVVSNETLEVEQQRTIDNDAAAAVELLCDEIDKSAIDIKIDQKSAECNDTVAVDVKEKTVNRKKKSSNESKNTSGAIPNGLIKPLEMADVVHLDDPPCVNPSDETLLNETVFVSNNSDSQDKQIDSLTHVDDFTVVQKRKRTRNKNTEKNQIGKISAESPIRSNRIAEQKIKRKVDAMVNGAHPRQNQTHDKTQGLSTVNVVPWNVAVKDRSTYDMRVKNSSEESSETSSTCSVSALKQTPSVTGTSDSSNAWRTVGDSASETEIWTVVDRKSKPLQNTFDSKVDKSQSNMRVEMRQQNRASLQQPNSVSSSEMSVQLMNSKRPSQQQQPAVFFDTRDKANVLPTAPDSSGISFVFEADAFERKSDANASVRKLSNTTICNDDCPQSIVSQSIETPAADSTGRIQPLTAIIANRPSVIMFPSQDPQTRFVMPMGLPVGIVPPIVMCENRQHDMSSSIPCAAFERKDAQSKPASMKSVVANQNENSQKLLETQNANAKTSIKQDLIKSKNSDVSKSDEKFKMFNIVEAQAFLYSEFQVALQKSSVLVLDDD